MLQKWSLLTLSIDIDQTKPNLSIYLSIHSPNQIQWRTSEQHQYMLQKWALPALSIDIDQTKPNLSIYLLTKPNLSAYQTKYNEEHLNHISISNWNEPSQHYLLIYTKPNQIYLSIYLLTKPNTMKNIWTTSV